MRLDPLVALADQHAELSDVLSTLGGSDWERPSRCEGWTVADVVTHLTQTDAMALASVQGRFVDGLAELAGDVGPATSVDEGAELMVTRERGRPGAEVRQRWQSGTEALRKAFAEADPHTRVAWVAGELSARTLTTTRLAETWIHTGDVAHAFGRVPAPTERLRHIARLAWRTLPYAFTRAGRTLTGPVAFELRGPSGEKWDLVPEEDALTVVRGDAEQLCLVAARRVDPSDTGLQAEGPDARAVLELVRTYA